MDQPTWWHIEDLSFDRSFIIPYLGKLHEDSKVCRYRDLCERTYFMFKHDQAYPSIVINESKNEDLVIVENESRIVDIDDGDEPDENIETADKTFVNPSQVDILSCESIVKCDKCDFEATKAKLI